MSDEITVLDLDWDLIQHLADQDSYRKLKSEQFSPDLIEDPLTRQVWDFQQDHVENHGTIASASILEDEFDDVFIAEKQAAVGDLIERMRKRFIRNQSQSVIEDIAQLTTEQPLDVAKQMLAEGRRLYDLTSARGESYGELDHDLAMADYDERAIQGRGPSLGFPKLDEHFNGQSGLTFLVGGPKNYKSWFTINAVHSNVNEGGFPYLYSLELPATDTNWRLKCMAANIPYWKYLRSALELDEREQVERSAEELSSAGRYRVEKPNPGARTVHQLVDKALNAGATCVFVDQLQYVETRKGHSLGALNDTGAYFEVLDDFRNYSDQIPIFIVHQFNRSVMNSDGMPEPQQGKGSAAIEETATLELGLWGNKDMRASNIIQMGTLVSRHYQHAMWEFGIELTNGCRLMYNGSCDE